MTSPKETSIDLWLDDALERLINQSDIGACLYACVKIIADRPENDEIFLVHMRVMLCIFKAMCPERVSTLVGKSLGTKRVFSS